MIKERIDYINKMKNEAANRGKYKDNDVLLIAVTKLRSVDEINEAIDSGITDIGENKVQEILSKYDKVKPGVKWHLIGHLQRNKVKYIIDKVDLIHSVDSLNLAKEIDKRAEQHGIIQDILVQVNTAKEESKFGVDSGDLEALIEQIKAECSNIKIRGLMCIAPYEENTDLCRPYFAETKALFDKLSLSNDFRYLSMGMSNDFEVAIEEGSNVIRVGSSIFGNRYYRSEEK